MVLKNILEESPKSILIEGKLNQLEWFPFQHYKLILLFIFLFLDSCNSRGRPLFNSLLNHFSNKGFKVHHIQYDFPLEELHTDWAKHDFFSDPLGFDANRVAVEKSLSYWTDQCQDRSIQYVIAIDTLSPLLLRLPTTSIFSTLRQIALRSTTFITHIFKKSYLKYF